MKTRVLSFLSLASAYVFLTSSATLIGGVGCGSSGSGGSGGTGGGGPMLDPNNLISDFEDVAAATVTQAGTPPRNGYWYPYNDDNPGGTDTTCTQVPISGPQAMAKGQPNPTYVGSAPPTLHDGTAGSLALHGVWSGCSVWGAGIGADLNQPAAADGGTYMGPKVPYDVTAYKGVSFWAMATAGSDTLLRIKFPMTDETKIVDGGLCDESDPSIGANKCSDDFGEKFTLPSNGTWKQFTIKFSDSAFKQEGWGHVFQWNPQHVTSIQIQSQEMGEMYDFWIDDMYLVTE